MKTQRFHTAVINRITAVLFLFPIYIKPPNKASSKMVARDIRIVEVRGSTPLCSTRKPCRSKSVRFFRAHFSVVQSMQILHSCPWYITQGFSFAACDPSHLFPPGHTRLANTPRILTINSTVQPCNRLWRSHCNSMSGLKTDFSACRHRHGSRR